MRDKEFQAENRFHASKTNLGCLQNRMKRGKWGKRDRRRTGLSLMDHVRSLEFQLILLHIY